jgi:hypothetical protein
MDIQSLLCTQQPVNYNEKSPIHIHHREPSWSSCSSSSPSSPNSSSVSYSIPSSPVIDIPSHTTVQRTVRNHSSTHSQIRTPWSSEEDQLLQQGYSQGLSWAMISTVYLPHRSRGCCWGRFKTLQAKSLEQREWSESEDRLLMLAIKKNARLFKQAWKAVAQDMGNRSWKECELRSTKVNIIKKKRQA